MRDKISRLQRYRLSRYAPPDDPLRRRMRWAWPVLALWIAWVGLASDHGFYRIWRLSQENARVRVSLDAIRGEIQRLDRQLRDPTWAKEMAERMLRERDGMARRKEIVYRIQETGKDTSRAER